MWPVSGCDETCETKAAWEEYERKAPKVVPRDRIRTPVIPRPPQELLEELRGYEGVTATISDILDSLGVAATVPSGVLRPVNPGSRAVGPCITVRYIPEQRTATYGQIHGGAGKLGDRDAYALARPGDVVVMDNGGRSEISTMGGLSTLSAIKAGIAGVIVDGGVRDVDVMKKEGFPVWSRGTTPITGKLRVETIEINGPVTCAGVRVNPGDVAVADDTGIVFIPQVLLEEVIRRLRQAVELEAKVVDSLRAGVGIADLRSVLPPEKW